MHVITIGYGKSLFDTASYEHERQRACAEAVDSLHVVVFARGQGRETVFGKLHVHASGGHTKIGLLLAAFSTARQILRARQPGSEWVLSTQDPFETGVIGWLLAAWYKIPFQVQVHGDFFSNPHWKQESILNPLRFWVGRWLLNKAASVRVVSPRLQVALVHLGLAADKIRLLPVAIPLERFAAVATHRSYDNNTVTILSVARFTKEKNLELLLRVFAAVHQTYPHSRLRLVGAGPEEKPLRALALRLGINQVVQWQAWSNEVPTVMAEADIYALTSNYEGYARVIPEAMAAGLPVVMTDVGCANDVCLDGQHGYVVPIGDGALLAERLQVLVAAPDIRAKFGKASHTRALSEVGSFADYPKRWAAAIV